MAIAVLTLELDYGPIKCYHIRQESNFLLGSIVSFQSNAGSLRFFRGSTKIQALDFHNQDFFHHTFLSFKRTLLHRYGKAGVDKGSTRRIGSPLFLLVETLDMDWK